MSTLRKNEDLFNYLATTDTRRKFYLACALWWEGRFQGLIGIIKNCLSKVTVRALLRYEKLEEVLLDKESFLNN